MATPKLVSISNGSDNLPDSRSGYFVLLFRFPIIMFQKRPSRSIEVSTALQKI